MWAPSRYLSPCRTSQNRQVDFREKIDFEKRTAVQLDFFGGRDAAVAQSFKKLERSNGDTRDQVCTGARAWRRRQGQDMRKLPGGVEHCRLRAQRAAAAIRSQSLPSRWSSTAGSTARDGSPTHHRTRGTCENLGSRQKGGGQMRTLCQATIQQRSAPQSNQSLRRPRRLKRICACLLRFPRAGGQSRIMKRKHEPGPHPTFTERYGSRTGSIVQKTRVSY